MIFRALRLMQPGLTAGWPADEIHVIFKILDRNNRLVALFNKRTALLQLYQCV